MRTLYIRKFRLFTSFMLVISFIFGSTPSLILAVNQDVFVSEEAPAVEDVAEPASISIDEVVEPMPAPEDESSSVIDEVLLTPIEDMVEDDVLETLEESVAEDAEVNAEEDEVLETPATDLVEDMGVPACMEVLMCEDVSQTIAPKNEGTTQSWRRQLPSSSGDFKQKEKEAERSFVPGEVLVRFKEKMIDLTTDVGLAAATAFAEANSLVITSTIIASNIAVMGVAAGREANTIAKLKYQPEVLHAQLNFQYEPRSNDTLFNSLWALENTGQLVDGLENVAGIAEADIDAPEAWAKNEGDDVIVAVIDTGVAFNHPDLLANMWDGADCVDENGAPLGGCQYGYDFKDDDKSPLPTSSSHGTHIAGTIGAVGNNNVGIIGVAPKTKIMALKTDFTITQIIRAINFAEQNGARIINASFSGQTSGVSTNELLLKEVAEQFSGIIVASAGNNSADHADTPSYPCAFDSSNIICVAATNQDDELASFSDYGAQSVDVGAPGTNILSTVADADIFTNNFLSGTTGELVAEGDWGVATTANSIYGDALFTDINNTPYAVNADAVITSPTIDLSAVSGATLDFEAACDTEYDLSEWTDYVTLEMSEDGVAFSRYGRFDEVLLDMVAGAPLEDDGISDIVSLPSSINNSAFFTDSFQFRFRWVTNGNADTGSDGLGCFIDNIRLSVIGDGTEGQYAFNQGTSMAAPHVAGVAALVKGYNTNIAVSKLKEIILNTGDALTSLAGKTVSEKRVNAANALNIFAPRVGTTVQDIVAVSDQSTTRDPFKIVSFVVKDGIAGLPFTMRQFEYSTDGGTTWQAPANGDSSEAISGFAALNGVTVEQLDATFFDVSYTFIFDAAHADLTGLVGTDQDDIVIRFKAHDGAVESPFAMSIPFRVDLLAPTAVLSGTPDVLTNATGATITVGGDDVALYKFSLDDDEFSEEGTPIAEPLAISGLTEGMHTLRVVAIDNTGNEQAVEDATTFTWTVDTTPGTALFVSKPDARTNQTDATIVIGGEDVATYTYTLDDGVAQGPFNVNVAITLANLIEGSHTIAVIGIDAPGNVQTQPTTYTWIIDTTSPTSILSDIPADPTKLNSATVVVGGVDVVAYRFSFDGGVFGPETSVATPITMTDLADGTHTIAVIARDDVGNYQTEANAITATWTVDTIAPALAEVTPVATPTNNATPTVVITVESGADWEIMRGEIVLVSGVGTGVAQSVELPTLTDGIYELTITAEDLAGNGASITLEPFVIDITSPTGLSLDGVPENPTNTTTATITLNAGSDVVLYRASVDHGAFGSETPVTTPIILTNLADGTHTVAVIARDEVGNWMPESGAIIATWVVDTLSPVVAFGNLPPSPTSSSRVEIIVGGEGVVVYRVSVDGGALGSETPVATPIILTELTEGTHTIAAIGRDAALNWQAEADATVFAFVYTIVRGGGRALGGGVFTPPTPAPVAAPVVPVAPTTRTLVPQVLGVRVFAEGVLIRVDGRSIYVVRGRTLHRIPDLGTLQRFADRTRIEVASEDTVGYDVGNPISMNLPTHTARTLLRVNARAIYVVNGSTLHRVPDVRSLWPYRNYTRVEVTENELVEFQVGNPVATL